VTEQDLDGVQEPDRQLELADARVKLQNNLRTTVLQAIAGLAVLAGAILGSSSSPRTASRPPPPAS
jgi:hypothetical protein